MTQRFDVEATTLAGLVSVGRRPIVDTRGAFVRMFCAEELAAAGWIGPVVQINLSTTARKGAVRGLHFQHAPAGEIKLVSCLRGEVWDVAVDLRRESATFLQWHGQNLSAANGTALLIPKGFAHGFQCLSDDCELLYLHSEPYSPAAEDGIHPSDPRLAIDWPGAITDMSDRDRTRPYLAADFRGV